MSDGVERPGWILPGKVVIGITWALAAICVVAPGAVPGALGTAGRWLFWGMLLVHVGELAIWMPLARKVGGSMPAHAMQVLLFGFVHGVDLKAQLASGDEAAASA